MAWFLLHRYSIKSPGTQFVDYDTLTNEEQAVWDNYVGFLQSQPGRVANTTVSFTVLDEDTIKQTWQMQAPDGQEQLFAENYMRMVGASNNDVRIAFSELMRSKESPVDVSKCYWEVEYANNHILTYKFGPRS